MPTTPSIQQSRPLWDGGDVQLVVLLVDIASAVLTQLLSVLNRLHVIKLGNEPSGIAPKRLVHFVLAGMCSLPVSCLHSVCGNLGALAQTTLCNLVLLQTCHTAKCMDVSNCCCLHGVQAYACIMIAFDLLAGQQQLREGCFKQLPTRSA